MFQDSARRNITALFTRHSPVGYIRRTFTLTQIVSTAKSQDKSLAANRDQISISAHPVSRLRLFKLTPRPGESERERSLREKRLQLQEWNHQYWCANNAEFNQMKKDFIKHELKNKERKDDLLNNSNQSHEELALFYKRFLDANRSKHIAYNFEWYKRNLALLWPSFLVKIERLFRR